MRAYSDHVTTPQQVDAAHSSMQTDIAELQLLLSQTNRRLGAVMAVAVMQGAALVCVAIGVARALHVL